MLYYIHVDSIFGTPFLDCNPARSRLAYKGTLIESPQELIFYYFLPDFPAMPDHAVSLSPALPCLAGRIAGRAIILAVLVGLAAILE